MSFLNADYVQVTISTEFSKGKKLLSLLHDMKEVDSNSSAVLLEGILRNKFNAQKILADVELTNKLNISEQVEFDSNTDKKR